MDAFFIDTKFYHLKMTKLSSEQLLNISQQFGTPLYVYNAEQITAQYKKLTTAFAETDTKFFYACKALTNINILKHIKSIGCNVDCSAINEVKLALMAGFEPANILYTSNGIHFSEIEEGGHSFFEIGFCSTK